MRVAQSLQRLSEPAERQLNRGWAVRRDMPREISAGLVFHSNPCQDAIAARNGSRPQDRHDVGTLKLSQDQRFAVESCGRFIPIAAALTRDFDRDGAVEAN